MSTGDQYPKKNDNTYTGDGLTTPYDTSYTAPKERLARTSQSTEERCIYHDYGCCSHKKGEAMTQGTERTNAETSWYSLQERIEELESRMSGMCELQQIQEGKAMEIRNIDDERFEKLELLSLKTDERIAALEKLVKGNEIVTSFVKDAWRKDINERISVLETFRMDTVAIEGPIVARLEALEKQYPPLTTIEALKKRIFYVENAVAALKVYNLPTACKCKGFESGIA